MARYDTAEPPWFRRSVDWSSAGQTSSEVYVDEVVVDDTEVRRI